MAHWLMKTEPDAWSWAQQAAAGTTDWDGVANPQALAAMRAMAVGDTALFYHTGDERRAVGVVEIVAPFRPDAVNPKLGVVTVRALHPLPRPVTLAAVKAEPRLAHLALVRQSRLSVMPVDAAAWALLLAMAGA